MSLPVRLMSGVCLIVATIAAPPANAACDFPAVKRQIDVILDQDADKAATFRAEVKSGSDSLAMIEKLAAPAMQEQIDICRFEAGEYLTKRGFPPFH